MNSTPDHAARLRSRGFALCKPDPDEKKPTYKAWPTYSLESDDFRDGDMLGIICGPLSDGNRPGHALVEIDLDAEDAVRLADEHLPPTDMEEGRPGKPRSHRGFLVPCATIPSWAVSTAEQAAPAALEAKGHAGPFKKQFRHAQTGECVFDFIGTGGQVVCPPSHSGGEPREWLGGEPGEPRVVPFPQLWAAVLHLAEACGCKLPEVNGTAPKPEVNGTPPKQASSWHTGKASPWLLSSRDSARHRAIAYVSHENCPVAISKKGGHNTMLWVARAVVYGFDLGADVGFEVLRDYYNPRCQPAWPEAQLLRKCKQADTLPFGKPRGWLLDEEQPAWNEGDFEGDRGEEDSPGGGEAPGQEAGQSVGWRDFHFTDRGNAERVLDRHGENIHYCEPMRKFFVWSGQNWQLDDVRAVERYVKETQRSLYRWATAKLKESGEPDGDLDKQAEAKKLLATIKHCLAWENQKKVAACIDSMKSERGVPIVPQQLDCDPFLFNCLSGTINLKTGEQYAHRRGDLLTKLAPVHYDPDAGCPLWLSCLDTWMAGNPALIGYLQRVAGYCLTGSVSEQVLWLFHGGGQNGKSVFLRTIQDLMGDYATSGVDDLLMQKRGQSHPTEIADLFGKRLVLTVEQDQGRKMAEAIMKKLTGEDVLKGRRMREDFWEFQPTHKIILAANHKPEIQGQDKGVWRRIKLVPWNVTIPDGKRDMNLLKKLEAEWPGILAWAVRGCLEWQRSGLAEPKDVTDATNAYRAEQNEVAEFIAECCTVNKELSVRAGILHSEFQKWLGRDVTKNAFAALMLANGYQSVPDSDKCKVYKGIGLNHKG
jgi:P4 family phage/plasmid primase-like protien